MHEYIFFPPHPGGRAAISAAARWRNVRRVARAFAASGSVDPHAVTGQRAGELEIVVAGRNRPRPASISRNMMRSALGVVRAAIGQVAELHHEAVGRGSAAAKPRASPWTSPTTRSATLGE